MTEKLIATRYKGSKRTFELVKKQIAERWGETEANSYDPYANARTFEQWNKVGYRVKKGEKALHSLVLLEEVDPQGKIVKRYPRNICLFYYRQVEKINQ